MQLWSEGRRPPDKERDKGGRRPAIDRGGRR